MPNAKYVFKLSNHTSVTRLLAPENPSQKRNSVLPLPLVLYCRVRGRCNEACKDRDHTHAEHREPPALGQKTRLFVADAGGSAAPKPGASMPRKRCVASRGLAQNARPIPRRCWTFRV